MHHVRNVQLSVRALQRARSRTALSALGMAIGIAAMVLLFGLGAGAERAFELALQEMGENILAISAGQTQAGALRGRSRGVETLLLSDMAALQDEIEHIVRAAPITLQQMQLRFADNVISSTVLGTTPPYERINKPRLAAGRFFTDDEVARHDRVVVIGATVARELFAGEQALGARLLMNNIPFTVIGVLQEKGVDPTGGDQDNRALIPVLTAQRRVLQVEHVDRIFVQTATREVLPQTEARIAAVLRARHALGEAPDDFTIRSQDALLATLNEVDGDFARLLTGLALLTLTLASIGLLATSLLSVRERESEIGLRMAVGALPRQVLGQFLFETILVALLGAAAGLLVGAGGIILGGQLLGWRVAWTWQVAAIPFLVSLGISILFGAYPAWRAARLDPIQALRSA